MNLRTRGDDERADEAENDPHAGADELLPELPGVAGDEARLGTVVEAEDAGGERTQEAADAVDAEGVQRVVVPEFALGADGDIADDRRRGAQNQRVPWRDMTCGGGHSDEPGDDS